MSQFATALKIGTTALVLDLIETGPRAAAGAGESDRGDEGDLAATRRYRWIIELRDGRKISAIDIQRLYLAAAREHCDHDEETRWLLREWEAVLDDLAARCHCAAATGWIGWRRNFCSTTFQESEGLEWSDPWLQSIDLEYHNVSLDQGLYYELMRDGPDAALRLRGRNPPRDLPAAGDDARLLPRPRRGASSTARSRRSNGTSSPSATAPRISASSCRTRCMTSAWRA